MVKIENVTKRFGEVVAVKNMNLDVRPGEFFILVGPSGGGKTTTLRMIGGFEMPTSGEIYIRGEPVAYIPPNKRDCCTVFQDLALFPHMSVGENIEYPLRVRRMDKDERRNRAIEMMRLVNLDREVEYERNVNALSGGQRQRVAIARALAARPSVLLLDEPLKDLDEALRRHMETELKKLHEEVGTTFIYVTHHQEEALSMGDRVGVINLGVLQQVAPPEELYYRPANSFVAEFIGAANVIKGVVKKIEEGTALVDCDGIDFTIPRESEEKGDEVSFMIRPERIKMGDEAKGRINHIPAKVDDIVFKGPVVDCYVSLKSGIRLRVQDTYLFHARSLGKETHIGWNPEDSLVYRKRE